MRASLLFAFRRNEQWSRRRKSGRLGAKAAARRISCRIGGSAGGAVERRPDPDDRRGKLIALIDAGGRFNRRHHRRHVANEARLLLSMTHAEQETLDALLKKLTAAL